MSTDTAFGSTGTIWTAVPQDRPRLPANPPERHYVGGEAVAVLPRVGAEPLLVIEAWNPRAWVPDATDPSRAVQSVEATRQVLLVEFGPAGRPADDEAPGGTRLAPLTPNGINAGVLAWCARPGGGLALLLREVAVRPAGPANPVVVATFRIVTLTPAGVDTTTPVPANLLFDPSAGGPTAGAVRLVPLSANSFLVTSSESNQIRLAEVGAGGAGPPTTFTVGGPGTALPGLIRVRPASARLDGAWVSLAMTADLSLPGLGGASVGALLRTSPTGAPDPSFGEQGLWVSPLSKEFRQFVCAGEFPSGVVGTQGAEVVAFRATPDGTGLDDLFGDGGVCRIGLGSPILSCVTADDGTRTSAMARLASGAAVVVCFGRTGTADATFGSGGLAAVPADGMPVTPKDLVVANGRLAAAVTRTLEGLDCDRVPALVVLDGVTGRPDRAYGAGGFALHASVGIRATFAPDGSASYVSRHEWGSSLQIRRADAAGRFERVVTIAPPASAIDATIDDLLALSDGSVLIAGSAGWFAKLAPDGTLDPQFGHGGVTDPIPGASEPTTIIGVRADGRIAVWVPDLGVGLLDAAGAVDTTYAATEATPGFVVVPGFTYLVAPVLKPGAVPQLHAAHAHLDDDGSVIVALGSSIKLTPDLNVEVALRRITPAGAVDPTFGLGLPNLTAPPGSRIALFSPAGATSSNDRYTEAEPVGMVWLGGRLHVAVHATTGGLYTAIGELESSPALVVTRWTADGKRDPTFGTFMSGLQEAGFVPQRFGIRPAGVLAYDSSRFLVYGEAGAVRAIPGSPSTVLRKQPALLSVTFPAGIDAAFGTAGADILTVQEFAAQTVAAWITPPPMGKSRAREVRFVCADVRPRPYPSHGHVLSNFGGIGQFSVGGPRFRGFRP